MNWVNNETMTMTYSIIASCKTGNNADAVAHQSTLLIHSIYTRSLLMSTMINFQAIPGVRPARSCATLSICTYWPAWVQWPVAYITLLVCLEQHLMYIRIHLEFGIRIPHIQMPIFDNVCLGKARWPDEDGD